MKRRTRSLGSLLLMAGVLTGYGTILQAANHRPVAMKKNLITTAEDNAKAFLLKGRDRDGDALSFRIVSRPTHGTLKRLRGPRRVNAQVWDTKWRYTPDADFNGEDSFRFRVSDGNLSSRAREVNLSITAVNDRPTTIKKHVTTKANTPRAFLLKGKDVDGDALRFRIVSRPTHGTLKRLRGPRRESALVWNTKWRYTPEADYSGEDFFRFRVSDGNLSSGKRRVGVTVKSVGGWGTAEVIGTTDNGYANLPDIAVNAEGNAMAVWEQWNDEGHIYSIWANRYVPGNGWETAELIETNDAGNARIPHVAVDPRGNAIAVWTQYTFNGSDIWSNRYVPGTGWGTAEEIETEKGYAVGAEVAFDSDGNAIAVWKHWDGIRYSIWSNHYIPGSGWGTAELIETNDGNANRPKVAVNARGNAIGIWSQWDGNYSSVYSNRYVPEVGWGTAELIETNDGNASSHTEIAIDADGNAIAVWTQRDDHNRWKIWANRYVAGIGWGTAELIGTNGDDVDVYDPQVTINANGYAMAVWELYDGNSDHIYANRYVPDIG